MRPGFARLELKADVAGLTISGFRNGENGSIVLVGVKRAGGPDEIRLNSPAGPVAWDLYQTTRELNCAKTDTVSVHDGWAQVPVRGESIFTLVGKGRR